MVVKEPRRTRTQKRNREALIDAAYHLMVRHGPDDVSMLQIAERADLGAGTVYNYFTSKNDIIAVVMERVHVKSTEEVREIAKSFDKPVDSCVFTVRACLIIAAMSPISSHLITKSVMAADTLFNMMGPYIMVELKAARDAGAVSFEDVELTWRLMTHAIVGFGIEVRRHKMSIDDLDESLITILGIFGIGRDAARKYAEKAWPEIPNA